MLKVHSRRLFFGFVVCNLSKCGYISSIKVSPKQYNIPYKANACLILKKIDTRFFRQYKYCLMNLCV